MEFAPVSKNGQVKLQETNEENLPKKNWTNFRQTSAIQADPVGSA